MEYRKEHIVLYGCSQGAENCIRSYPDVIVDYCIDDTLHGRSFHEFPIYRPSDRFEDLKSKYTLVFTDNNAVYERISGVFKKQGLSEFEHYIPYNLFGKKIALTWGNCHVEYVRSFLMYSQEFASDYAFYNKKNLWDMKESDFDRNIFEHCDMLVCQHIRERNSLSETFSSVNIEKNLKKDCLILKFPNLFGLPRFLFPQTYMDDMYVRAGGGIIWYRDRNIDRYLQQEKNADVDDIYEKVMKYEYAVDEIWEQYILFCEKLAGREKQCNIHIMDYIMEHLKDEKLFLDIEHPGKKLLGEIANRILGYLGYQKLDGNIVIPGVYAHEVFIYPSVKKIFGMQWEERDIKADNNREKIQPVYMDIKEYVRQYCMIYTDGICEKMVDEIPVSYTLFVEEKENKGAWQKECTGGMAAGTTAQGKRCSAVKILLEQKDVRIEYRVFLHGVGWTDYVQSGQVCGVENLECYIQAIQIRLTGAEACKYSVYYQVHCQNTGWSESKENGDVAGNVEQSLRLEAIKIRAKRITQQGEKAGMQENGIQF